MKEEKTKNVEIQLKLPSVSNFGLSESSKLWSLYSSKFHRLTDQFVLED